MDSILHRDLLCLFDDVVAWSNHLNRSPLSSSSSSVELKLETHYVACWKNHLFYCFSILLLSYALYFMYIYYTFYIFIFNRNKIRILNKNKNKTAAAVPSLSVVGEQYEHCSYCMNSQQHGTAILLSSWMWQSCKRFHKVQTFKYP